jgi:phospholipase C
MNHNNKRKPTALAALFICSAMATISGCSDSQTYAETAHMSNETTTPIKHVVVIFNENISL